ncbi:MAG TPA: hypothetical protein VG518_08140 [Solirubrobacterales bacterium]|nr:hypothetical protein [Solirubrobacterales bacterium]
MKLAAVLGVIALLALAGCGGSGSTDSSTTGSTTAEAGAGGTDTTGGGQGVGGPNSQEGSAGKDKTGSGGSGSSGAGSGSAEGKGKGGSGSGQGSTGGGKGGSSTPKPKTDFKAPPVKVSGGGSSRFIVKGGDNSIQEFGQEGSGSELTEAAEAVHGFTAARAEERWDAACSYLAKSNVESLEKLGSQSPQFKDSGCGAILAAFTRPLPASVEREITTIDAASLRREGEQGFLIYRGADKTIYAMPLRSEGGAWKVAGLSGTPLN